MKIGFLAFLVALAFCSPAFAAKQCYSLDELKAEEWIRLHSQLMVIKIGRAHV